MVLCWRAARLSATCPAITTTIVIFSRVSTVAPNLPESPSVKQTQSDAGYLAGLVKNCGRNYADSRRQAHFLLTRSSRC